MTTLLGTTPTEKQLLSILDQQSDAATDRSQYLVLLWAIGRTGKQEKRLIHWHKADKELIPLFRKHGPGESTPTPEESFVTLRDSPFWDLVEQDGENPPEDATHIRNWLDENNPAGGLERGIHELLTLNHEIRERVVAKILEKYFTEYPMREELLLDSSLIQEPFNDYGTPPYIATGSVFSSRKAVRAAGLHTHIQAGIWGREAEEAKSIVASGGYEDDKDLGDHLLYTGQGGRGDKKNQIKDQELVAGNAALVNSEASGRPVRVIRGFSRNGKKLYRYDGLYRVTEHWRQRGKSERLVWMFRLEQLPEGELSDQKVMPRSTGGNQVPGRKTSVTQRVVRSTDVANFVKKVHKYTCQVCGIRLDTPTGSYAESAHIRGLGRPHNGPDEPDNILCLCPNHHVMFDYGMLAIHGDGKILERDRSGNTVERPSLITHPDHKVNPEHLAYHRKHHAIGVSSEN